VPGFQPAFDGDYVLRPKLLPDIGVIPLAVELGLGQHELDARLLGSSFGDCEQIRAIVLRATSRDLRQQELQIQIRHDHHSINVYPAAVFAGDEASVAHEGVDCPLRQARRINRDTSSPFFFRVHPAQPTRRLAERQVYGLVAQKLQKANRS
jgi:hypothetical protein